MTPTRNFNCVFSVQLREKANSKADNDQITASHASDSSLGAVVSSLTAILVLAAVATVGWFALKSPMVKGNIVVHPAMAFALGLCTAFGGWLFGKFNIFKVVQSVGFRMQTPADSLTELEKNVKTLTVQMPKLLNLTNAINKKLDCVIDTAIALSKSSNNVVKVIGTEDFPRFVFF